MWIIFKNIVKSASFIGLYVATFRYMLCITKNSRQKIDKWNPIAACFVCSFAMILEGRSRGREIMLYMIPRVFESLYNYAVERGMAKHFVYGEVLVFAFSMALIMYYYENRPENIKPTNLSLLRKFFGVN